MSISGGLQIVSLIFEIGQLWLQKNEIEIEFRFSMISQTYRL